MNKVPQVLGQSEDIASQMIREAGFVPKVNYEYNALINQSVVMSQSPLPNELMGEGGEVTITVSLGVETVSVPNVMNRDYTEAANLIEQAGLKVGDVTHEISDAPNDYVIGQDPGADEVIPVNETYTSCIIQKQ